MANVATEKEVRTVVEAAEIVKRAMAADPAEDRRKEMAALHIALLEFEKAVSEKTPLYNHLFVVAFSVVSTDPTGELVEPETIRQGLRHRLEELHDDDELMEAVGLPQDTYRIGE